MDGARDIKSDTEGLGPKSNKLRRTTTPACPSQTKRAPVAASLHVGSPAAFVLASGTGAVTPQPSLPPASGSTSAAPQSPPLAGDACKSRPPRSHHLVDLLAVAVADPLQAAEGTAVVKEIPETAMVEDPVRTEDPVPHPQVLDKAAVEDPLRQETSHGKRKSTMRWDRSLSTGVSGVHLELDID